MKPITKPKKSKKLELENVQSYHFVFVGFAEFKDVFKKLIENLPYYRFEHAGKEKEREIFYDVPDELLSTAGLILSKWYSGNKIYFHIRKISTIVGAMKRPSKKFLFGSCEDIDEPKDFSLQISSAIENSFTSPFTVDLDSIVKSTRPIIEVDIQSDKYNIICGTGYRAVMLYENAIYKDIKTGEKVSRLGVTFKFPLEEREETDEILDVLSRRVLGLAHYDNSRFEIAQQLLYSKIDEEALELNKDDEEEEEE